MNDSETSPANIIELDAFRAEVPDRASKSEHGLAREPEHEDALDFYVREEALFRQNIQLDLAHERMLMYRVALVMLWIVAMVLVRQWIMAALSAG